MKTPCWRTSVVHQYGGWKIVLTSGTYFGCLGEWSCICTEQTGIYLSTFCNALTSKKGSKPWDKYIFFNKLDRRPVSRTAITHKFKMPWLPNEERDWALKLRTDINLPPLKPDEDRNFRGSLVLDFRKWWRHMKTIYIIYLQVIWNPDFSNLWGKRKLAQKSDNSRNQG